MNFWGGNMAKQSKKSDDSEQTVQYKMLLSRSLRDKWMNDLPDGFSSLADFLRKVATEYYEGRLIPADIENGIQGDDLKDLKQFIAAIEKNVLEESDGEIKVVDTVKIPKKCFVKNHNPCNNWCYGQCLDNLGKIVEVDHILAYALGGDPLDMENLQSLCHECHAIKTGNDRRKMNKKDKQEQFEKEPHVTAQTTLGDYFE